LQRLVARIPTLRYQMQFADPELNEAVDSDPAKLRGFFDLVFGGQLEGKEENSWNRGIEVERLVEVGHSPIVGRDTIEQYVEVFRAKGMNGPFNWYRTRKLNYEDELVFAKRDKVHRFPMPAMLVMATEDIALPPSLAEAQAKFFEGGLRKVTVEASHWVAVEKPDEVNRLIGEFVTDILGKEVVKEKL
jgi:soluble epoxide hydrolase/lipid-phosphate phosphatase